MFAYESIFQSKNIPIPLYPPVQSSTGEISVTFIGRLAREILRITDPRTTYYIEKKNAWYDLKTKEEVVNMKLFKKLEQSLNSFGLHGLDRLFSFMISKDLQTITSSLQRYEKQIEEIYKSFAPQMEPLDTNSNLNAKFYQTIIGKFSKLFSFCLDTF